MKIKAFDRKKGFYQFELAEITTDFHAHPAVEILFSKTGGIGIETDKVKLEKLSFAIIDANIIHKVTSQVAPNSIMMLECNAANFKVSINQLGFQLENGLYIESDGIDRTNLMDKFFLYLQNQASLATDLRVQTCLNYLNSTASEYDQMMNILKTKTYLSKSRLSHVFKKEIGISIKKYLVWSRLKRAFELVIKNEMNMYQAALQSGFYDQAHLSKAFKKMLGMSPSEVYNSRMLQD